MANKRIRMKRLKMQQEQAPKLQLPTIEEKGFGRYNRKQSYKEAKKEARRAAKKKAQQARLFKTLEDDEDNAEYKQRKVRRDKEEKKKRSGHKKRGRKPKWKKPKDFTIHHDPSDKYLPKEQDIILDNLYLLIQKLEYADVTMGITERGYTSRKKGETAQLSEDCRLKLLQIIHDEINATNEQTVARRIESVAQSGELNQIVDTILYSMYREKIIANYQRLANILKGSMLTYTEAKYWGDIDSSLDGEYGE